MSSILYSTTGILGRSLDAAASGTNDTTVGPDLAEIVGWVSANNDRGTADVIWSSCVTIFLCVWVATSPNVPGPDDKWYHMWHDKLNLAFIGLAGPDFLLALAVGQLSSARRNVQMFRQLPGGHSWTLKHGFLADMGGFYIRAPDYPNGFPINGEQLVYLIKHGHLDLPALTEQDINHRSKIDGLSKVITIWQAAWFIITQAQRIAKGYPITTLELTALSFSAVMIVISASWYHKPSISQCIFLDTKDGLTIAAIRDDARSKSKTHPDLPENYHRTPLDFISRRPLLIDELWQYHSAMSHRLYVPFFTRPLKSTPWERFPSDTWFEVTDLRLHLLGPAVVVPFSVSFLASWNFHFATTAERNLWRFCAIYHAFFSILVYILFMQDYTSAFFKKIRRLFRRVLCIESSEGGGERGTGICNDNRSGEESQNTSHRPLRTAGIEELVIVCTGTDTSGTGTCVVDGSSSQGQGKTTSRAPSKNPSRIKAWLDSLRTLSPANNPQAEAQLRRMLSLGTLSSLYLLCRLYIYIEDFISLRSQPQGVYMTVNKFLPFIS